jgi:hypothetical protein
MKRYAAAVVISLIFCGSAGGAAPYNPYGYPSRNDSREARREQALKEKAEESAMRRRADLLSIENKELKSQIEDLTRKLEEKNGLILELKGEITRLNKTIESLTPKNEDGVVIDGIAVHGQSIFDVYLGEPYEGAIKRVKVLSENPGPQGNPQAGKVVELQPTRDFIKSMHVRILQDRICEISVSYKDSSLKKCESIRKQLIDTFKFQSANPAGNRYSTVLDGIPVDIVIEHVSGPGKQAQLTLHYLHKPLDTVKNKNG